MKSTRWTFVFNTLKNNRRCCRAFEFIVLKDTKSFTFTSETFISGMSQDEQTHEIDFPYQIKNFGKITFFTMIKLLISIPIQDNFFKLAFYGDYLKTRKLLDNVDF